MRNTARYRTCGLFQRKYFLFDRTIFFFFSIDKYISTKRISFYANFHKLLYFLVWRTRDLFFLSFIFRFWGPSKSEGSWNSFSRRIERVLIFRVCLSDYYYTFSEKREKFWIYFSLQLKQIFRCLLRNFLDFISVLFLIYSFSFLTLFFDSNLNVLYWYTIAYLNSDNWKNHL